MTHRILSPAFLPVLPTSPRRDDRGRSKAHRTTSAVLAAPGARRSRVRASVCTPGESIASMQNDTQVANAVATGAVVVLKLYARSCRACLGVAPRFRKLARAYAGRANFLEMELNASSALAAELGVNALPYFAVYKGGSLVAAEALALRRISRLADRVDKLVAQ